jgi:hypothetical protein
MATLLKHCDANLVIFELNRLPPLEFHERLIS